MGHITENILSLRQELPSGVELVAVSKFKSGEEILEAYEAGQRVFGESRPQELKEKAMTLPKDIEWHFIGHLQSNKIKMTVPYVKLIHSVDTPKLFFEIEKWCRQNGYSVDVLLEMHIASEESKQGFSDDEVLSFLEGIEKARQAGYSEGFPSQVRIRGIMGMASLTEDEELIRKEFGHLNSVFDRIRALGYPFLDSFDLKSFGMTHDYHVAVEMGSNMVRIGTKMFVMPYVHRFSANSVHIPFTVCWIFIA